MPKYQAIGMILFVLAALVGGCAILLTIGWLLEYTDRIFIYSAICWGVMALFIVLGNHVRLKHKRRRSNRSRSRS